VEGCRDVLPHAIVDRFRHIGSRGPAATRTAANIELFASRSDQACIAEVLIDDDRGIRQVAYVFFIETVRVQPVPEAAARQAPNERPKGARRMPPRGVLLECIDEWMHISGA